MSPKAPAAWPFELRRDLAGLCRARLPAQDPDKPARRKLRVFSHDPSRSRYDGAHVTVSIPYEPLTPGPAGAVVVVEDTAEGGAPVDLEQPRLLMEDGLQPSSSCPQFMQQMAYAVAMETYDRFRDALGRDPGFGPIKGKGETDGKLRIRPRAMNEANAYYDRQMGSLDFGYEKAAAFAHYRNQPGSNVYLVLTREIVVHETSHALLDGLRSNFVRPTHRDVMALHEGFSDLVAIFMRFAQSDLVRQAIEESRGQDLESKLLVDIGHQFGFDLVDGHKPLRTAIRTPRLEDAVVDVELGYEEDRLDKEEHDLGTVLVSAVFEAFRRVYQRKTEKLRALVPIGQRLPSEAVHLLADEAAHLARRFLNIVIRAIDYCPPVHCTFGEYLRAIVTADYDLVPEDPVGYREAFINAFRRYRITVPEVEDLSEESLLWRSPQAGPIVVPELDFRRLGLQITDGRCDWPLNENGRAVTRAANAFGLAICRPDRAYDFGLIEPSASVKKPMIVSLRTLRRISTGGDARFDLVAEIVQKRRVREGWFLGGATVIVSSDGEVRYSIAKHLDSKTRLKAQRAFLRTQSTQVREAAWAEPSMLAAHLQRRIHCRK